MPSHKNIRLLTWFNFFQDFRPYNAFAAIYFSQITGSFTLGLSIFTVRLITSALFEVPTGILSDKLGRKKTMILGATAAIVEPICYALGYRWPILLFVGAVFSGLSRAFFSGNNEALLYDSLMSNGQEKEYAEFLGKTSYTFQIALGLSALLGGFLGNWSLEWVMWISVIPQMICLILAWSMMDPKTHTQEKSRVWEHLKEAKLFKNNRKVRIISVVAMLDYGIGETMHTFNPIFIASLWPTWAIGAGRMITHGLAAVSFWFAGKMIKKQEPGKSLMIGQLGVQIVNITAFALNTVFSPFLMSMTALYHGFQKVAHNSLLQEEFTDAQRATLGSLNGFFGSLFYGAFNLAFGLIADQLGAANSLILGEILLIPTLFMYWQLSKHHKQLAAKPLN